MRTRDPRHGGRGLQTELENIFRFGLWSPVFIGIMMAFIMSQIAPAGLNAAGSTFTTSLTTTGVVSAPPSIPLNLSATAVSSSQIDLAWDASTAALYAIGGYRVFRDGIFAATTTGTTYSDLGLSADTAYEYTVEAFDTALNLSGQSSPVTATTSEEAIVIPPNTGSTTPGTPGTSGTHIAYPVISQVAVLTSLTKATVSFNTNVPTQARIFWGQMPDDETGSLSSLFYGTEHQLLINSLTPNTKYYVRIEVSNSYGRTATAQTTFVTTEPQTVHPLANPSNFAAHAMNDRIRLSWLNPQDPQFQNVRIVKGEQFFPRDQFDGVPVYEGSGTSFMDTEVVSGKTYYYAIFAKGSDGSYSSGALAQARITPSGEIFVPPASDPFADIIDSSHVDPMIAALTFGDFDFFQEGKLLSNFKNQIAINGSENLTIRLDYSKVPEILKTIAFTLTDPEDETKVFPFLLRVNADKTAYEATIGPLGRSGNYELKIVIMDYQNKGLKRIQGNIHAIVLLPQAPARKGFDPLGIVFLLLLLLILLLLFILRRRNEKPRIIQGASAP